MQITSTRWVGLAACVLGFSAITSASNGLEGRWKLGGDGTCFFDETDEGPDQCTPPAPTGRWKLGGDGSCFFDANDSGPDQCMPPAE